MKKKLLAVLLCATLAFAVTACGSDKDDNKDGGSSSVFDDADSDEEEPAEVADKPVAEEPVEEASTGDGVITFELPEGFVETTTPGMYYGPGYEDGDTSNIYYSSQESDPAQFSFTSEQFETLVEETYLSSYGWEVDVVMTSFEETEIDGNPAILLSCEYDLQGVSLKQTELMVQVGNIANTLNFTMLAGAGWDTAFQTCLDSVEVVYN